MVIGASVAIKSVPSLEMLGFKLELVSEEHSVRQLRRCTSESACTPDKVVSSTATRGVEKSLLSDTVTFCV